MTRLLSVVALLAVLAAACATDGPSPPIGSPSAGSPGPASTDGSQRSPSTDDPGPIASPSPGAEATPFATAARTPSGTPILGPGPGVVGDDLPPGRYRAVNVVDCYWERLTSFGGSVDEVIAFTTITGASAIVDLLPTDTGFNSRDCGQWYHIDDQPITADPTRFGDGVYLVGVDVAPGRYRNSGSGLCYWERSRDFTGEYEGIIDFDDVEGSVVVEIEATDVGFTSQGCGTWSPA